MEEALGYKNIMDEYGLSQEEVSKAVGKSRPTVANTLRLLKLPDGVSSMVRDGSLSAGHARALLSFDDEGEMQRVAEEIALGDFSVRQIERMAQQSKKEKKAKKAERKPAYYTMVEQTLTEYLGKKVKVAPSKGKGGVLQIEFYSDEELGELARKLEDDVN